MKLRPLIKHHVWGEPTPSHHAKKTWALRWLVVCFSSRTKKQVMLKKINGCSQINRNVWEELVGVFLHKLETGGTMTLNALQRQHSNQSPNLVLLWFNVREIVGNKQHPAERVGAVWSWKMDEKFYWLNGPEETWCKHVLYKILGLGSWKHGHTFSIFIFLIIIQNYFYLPI